MPDANLPFYRRGSANNVPFAGLRQHNEPHCVFASIAGAVNHLAGSTVWKNAHDLYTAWKTSGKGMAFDAVIPIALALIPDQLKYDIPRERIKNDPPQSLVDGIDACLGSDGIAIISLEAYETEKRTQGLGCWHMLTIIDKAGDWYQVWDTNGAAGSITADEIRTALSAYGIECQGKQYSHVWFHRHDTHDSLMLWKA